MIFFDCAATTEERHDENNHANYDEDNRCGLDAGVHEIRIVCVDYVNDGADSENCDARYLLIV